jgi:hypothetical protein
MRPDVASFEAGKVKRLLRLLAAGAAWKNSRHSNKKLIQKIILSEKAGVPASRDYTSTPVQPVSQRNLHRQAGAL